MVTLLASLAVCMLYACQHMTLPGTESLLSEQGLSPSAVPPQMCIEELVNAGGTDCNVANDVAGGLGVPQGCFVSSNYCVLRRPSPPAIVEVSQIPVSVPTLKHFAMTRAANGERD